MALKRRRVQRKRRLTRRGRRTHGVSVGIRGAYPTLPPFGIVGTRRGRRVGVGLKRRNRGRSVTITKRRRVVKDPGGYQQWQRSAFSRKLGRLTQQKINRANTDIFDLMWKRVGRLDGGGQLFAGSWLDSTTIPDEAWRPIFLVNLTSGIVANVVSDPVVQLRRKLSAASPEYVFHAIQGQTPTGTLASPWNRVVNPSTTTTNQSLSDVSILKWSEIRADIWGAKDHPCEWEFTLCQIDPDVLPAASSASLTSRQGVDFWDQVSTKLTFSPTNRQIANGIQRNMIKVIDRKSFLLNPTSTTESDVDPHVRSVRLFYRMNRKCKFTWSNVSPIALTDDVDPAQLPNYDPFMTGDSHATVEPKARVFLMITCKNWRAPVASYAGVTTQNTGSMNLSVYNRWVT